MSLILDALNKSELGTQNASVLRFEEQASTQSDSIDKEGSNVQDQLLVQNKLVDQDEPVEQKSSVDQGYPAEKNSLGLNNMNMFIMIVALLCVIVVLLVFVLLRDPKELAMPISAPPRSR